MKLSVFLLQYNRKESEIISHLKSKNNSPEKSYDFSGLLFELDLVSSDSQY